MPSIQKKKHLASTYREIVQDQIAQLKLLKAKLFGCIVLADKLDLTIITSEHRSMQDDLLTDKTLNMHRAAYKMASLKQRQLNIDIERYIQEIKNLDTEMSSFREELSSDMESRPKAHGGVLSAVGCDGQAPFYLSKVN